MPKLNSITNISLATILLMGAIGLLYRVPFNFSGLRLPIQLVIAINGIGAVGGLILIGIFIASTGKIARSIFGKSTSSIGQCLGVGLCSTLIMVGAYGTIWGLGIELTTFLGMYSKTEFDGYILLYSMLGMGTGAMFFPLALYDLDDYSCSPWG